MGFIKDTFLGGAEERAAGRQVAAGRRGQEFIREGTTGARGELETGFGGAEEALREAFASALGVQETGLQDIIASLTGGAEQAIGTLRGGEERGIQSLLSGLTGAQTQLDPFAGGGQSAFELQLAQSGALGPEAQARAFQAFTESPAVAFQREQGERAINRQAAATGDLGGGTQLTDLLQFGQGLAQQDFSNQFGRLGQLAGRGQGAASQLAQATLGTGGNIADLIRGTTQGVAGQQSNLGQLLAQALGQSTRDISGLFGTQGTQLANLRTGLGSNLAQLLLGESANLSNLEQGIGAAQAQGILSSTGVLRSTLGDLFALGQEEGGGFSPSQLFSAFGFGG
jgi:hypothetical protein